MYKWNTVVSGAVTTGTGFDTILTLQMLKCKQFFSSLSFLSSRILQRDKWFKIKFYYAISTAQ